MKKVSKQVVVVVVWWWRRRKRRTHNNVNVGMCIMSLNCTLFIY